MKDIENYELVLQLTSQPTLKTEAQRFLERYVKSGHFDPGDVLEVIERVSTESGEQVRRTFISPADAVAVHVKDPDAILEVNHFIPKSIYNETRTPATKGGYLRIEKAKILVATPEPQLKLGKVLLYLFLDKENIQAEIGDIDELFYNANRDVGRRAATIVYYRHVLKSIWPQLRRSLIKWGIFGWVTEVIRRIGS